MKLLFLSKQSPQGKDLLARPYGRFFHIPQSLQKLGHEIHILLLSYKRHEKIDIRKLEMDWYSRSVWARGSSSFRSTALSLVKRIQPDWIVGFSDTYYGIMAEHLAGKCNCRSLIDAYDNYESYLPCFFPLHFLWRRALSQATAVTAAGPQLAALLQKFRPQSASPVSVIPMAVDPTGFAPLDKAKCRHAMNLPLEKKIVGYHGSISRGRGIGTLFEALNILRKTDCNIDLVLTGPKGKSVNIPPSVKWLGYLTDEEVPVLLNCFDLISVITRPSAFGNYSYPVKLYEAMQCRIPVVATYTPPVNWILKSDERFLVRPDSPCDLADKIRQNLSLDRVDYGRQTTWEDASKDFEEILLR